MALVLIKHTCRVQTCRARDYRAPTFPMRNYGGADLSGARLQGADLEHTGLQGADLSDARLQGAHLRGAQLAAADLRAAELQGADLSYAELQGADLRHAELQGADLSDAKLQGARLESAQLQGADLSCANWTETELKETFVFGSRIEDRPPPCGLDLSTIAILSLRSDKVKLGERGKVEPLSPSDVEAWAAAVTPFVNGWEKTNVAERFGRLKAALAPDFHEDAQQATWSGMEEASLALGPQDAHHQDAHHQRLATLFGDLACEPYQGRLYIARRLVGPTQQSFYLTGRLAAYLAGPLAALGDSLGSVRARMKAGREKTGVCWGVMGFTDEDWERLDALKATDPGAR